MYSSRPNIPTRLYTENLADLQFALDPTGDILRPLFTLAATQSKMRTDVVVPLHYDHRDLVADFRNESLAEIDIRDLDELGVFLACEHYDRRKTANVLL